MCIGMNLQEFYFSTLFFQLINWMLFRREHKKQSVAKRPVFHLKWKAFYYSNKFQEWSKDIAISSVIPDSVLNLTMDLFNHQERKIIKGIDFDLGKTSLNRKLYETDLIV